MTFDLEALIGKLNATCRKGLEEAAALCVSQSNYNVEIEHFLLKLMEQPETDWQQLLQSFRVNRDEATRQLTSAIDRFKRGNSRTPSLSPQIPELLQESWLQASLHLGASRVRSAAVLLALLDQERLRGMLLESCPALLRIPRQILRQEVGERIRGSSEDAPPAAGSGSVASTTPALDQYTLDLTARAQAGMVDPILGRSAEIRQIINILLRRRQNNPILVGEAGVGKTAVVEGLALRIAEGDVPPVLHNIGVRMLDLGLLQAGAGVRGEFEQRLKSVIAEITASSQPIILFIDEAHALIGAGGPAGQGDAANLLKPPLARGELRTIAATTWAEYKRYFENDPALARRFQVVKIDEPGEATAIDMLQGVAANLARHHNVRILSEAVRDAVKLSRRYIAGRQLPDKAISVLDTACARVAIGQAGTPPALEDVIRRLDLLEVDIAILKREQAAGENHAERVAVLLNEVAQLRALRHRLESQWQRELTEVQRIQGLERQIAQRCSAEVNDATPHEGLIDELVRLKAQLADLQGDDPLVPMCVDSRVVAAVIAGWTGIPVGKMLTDELRLVLTLKDKMVERIVGQPQAVDAICRRIRTSRADMVDPGKPVGVFLLVGPSGVGKTETAMTLADLLYGGERHMVVINMSEYQEVHTVSSLRGAPPGYVGYGKGGVLTEAVRRNPYAVILLDEVEKAHPDVMELFYQVFDKGTLEDAEGVVVDFTNSVIFLTCNIAAETVRSACRDPDHRPDVETLVEMMRPTLLAHFRPALLGRLVIVPYYPLRECELQGIVKLKLAKVQERFREKYGAEMTYDAGLVPAIAAACTEVDSGARKVDHTLTQTLLPELSSRLLMRMALGTGFSRVHIALDEAGGFVYSFLSPTGQRPKVPHTLESAPEVAVLDQRSEPFQTPRLRPVGEDTDAGARVTRGLQP